MRILFLGDVVGRSAREAVIKEIPEIRRNFSIDFVSLRNCPITQLKKIIRPTDEDFKKHKEYLKNNLKKNFFN